MDIIVKTLAVDRAKDKQKKQRSKNKDASNTTSKTIDPNTSAREAFIALEDSHHHSFLGSGLLSSSNAQHQSQQQSQQQQQQLIMAANGLQINQSIQEQNLMNNLEETPRSSRDSKRSHKQQPTKPQKRMRSQHSSANKKQSSSSESGVESQHDYGRKPTMQTNPSSLLPAIKMPMQKGHSQETSKRKMTQDLAKNAILGNIGISKFAVADKKKKERRKSLLPMPVGSKISIDLPKSTMYKKKQSSRLIGGHSPVSGGSQSARSRVQADKNADVDLESMQSSVTVQRNFANHHVEAMINNDLDLVRSSKSKNQVTQKFGGLQRLPTHTRDKKIHKKYSKLDTFTTESVAAIGQQIMEDDSVSSHSQSSSSSRGMSDGISQPNICIKSETLNEQSMEASHAPSIQTDNLSMNGMFNISTPTKKSKSKRKSRKAAFNRSQTTDVAALSVKNRLKSLDSPAKINIAGSNNSSVADLENNNESKQIDPIVQKRRSRYRKLHTAVIKSVANSDFKTKRSIIMENLIIDKNNTDSDHSSRKSTTKPKFVPISQMQLLKDNVDFTPGSNQINAIEVVNKLNKAKTQQAKPKNSKFPDKQDDSLEDDNPDDVNSDDGQTGATKGSKSMLFEPPSSLELAYKPNSRKRCLFYPHDFMKKFWDLICGICLVTSCLTVPFYLSVHYYEDEEYNQSFYINLVVDICFFIDIVVTFNTAVPVSQVKVLECRKEIAKHYLSKWFWIDVLVTIPYDLLIKLYDPSLHNVANLPKFIRIMKIVRLIRLIKLVKVAKDRKKMAAILASSLQLDYAIERLILSIFGFMLLCHVIACLWILQARLQESPSLPNWITEKGFSHAGDWELYFAAYYFSVTTFTTVGYGDIHATCTTERVLSIFLMIGGVFAFSFATGTITSILTSLDQTNKLVNEKMLVVNKLSYRYDLDQEIKQKLHATIRFQVQNSTEEFTEFLSMLDPILRQRVYREMYNLTRKKIQFFQQKTDHNFIEWICPLLKVVILIADMPIYREQEEILAIYFLEQGQAAYVLPRYQNAPFVKICESETFGLIDIVFRQIENSAADDQDQRTLDQNKQFLHKFTCQTQQNSVIQQLSMEDLKRMELEYKEVYDELFYKQDTLLERALEQKKYAQTDLAEANQDEAQSPELRLSKKHISTKPMRRASRLKKGKRHHKHNTQQLARSSTEKQHGASELHHHGSNNSSVSPVRGDVLDISSDLSPMKEQALHRRNGTANNLMSLNIVHELSNEMDDLSHDEFETSQEQSSGNSGSVHSETGQSSTDSVEEQKDGKVSNIHLDTSSPFNNDSNQKRHSSTSQQVNSSQKKRRTSKTSNDENSELKVLQMMIQKRNNESDFIRRFSLNVPEPQTAAQRFKQQFSLKLAGGPDIMMNSMQDNSPEKNRMHVSSLNGTPAQQHNRRFSLAINNPVGLQVIPENQLNRQNSSLTTTERPVNFNLLPLPTVMETNDQNQNMSQLQNALKTMESQFANQLSQVTAQINQMQSAAQSLTPKNEVSVQSFMHNTGGGAISELNESQEDNSSSSRQQSQANRNSQTIAIRSTFGNISSDAENEEQKQEQQEQHEQQLKFYNTPRDDEGARRGDD